MKGCIADMDENTEKKKNHRKHYRNRNKDKAKRDRSEEQKRRDGQDRPEEQGRRERSERSERPDRRGRQKRQEAQKKQGIKPDTRDKADTATEEDLEEISSRSKRDPVEPVFEFTWGDAWGLYGTGYHVVIKDNEENKDKLYLSWSVDLKYGEMRISQKLQEFLDDIKACGVQSWDGQRYTKAGIIDGDTWYFKVNSLSIKAEAQGTNEYPAEWKQLLSCLHEKWGVPVSKREQWE